MATKERLDGDGTRELFPWETDAKKAAKPPKKGEVPASDRSLQEITVDDLPRAEDDPEVVREQRLREAAKDK
jgi:hypothetical protein